MKALLFAAALAVGGTAFAQTGNTVADQSQASGPQGITQQGTDPNGQACTPPGFNAGSSAYPTCGAGAGAGGGTTDTTGAAGTTGTTGVGTTPPPCSRTVTDGCIQTYERGVRRR
ncbi:MAG TPA: hypothetical protein VGB08_01935 [Allosphingosinicella sp.]|jgi:hypothetical protein